MSLVERQQPRRSVPRCQDNNREIGDPGTDIAVPPIQLLYLDEIDGLEPRDIEASRSQVFDEPSVAMLPDECLKVVVHLGGDARRKHRSLAFPCQQVPGFTPPLVTLISERDQRSGIDNQLQFDVRESNEPRASPGCTSYSRRTRSLA